MAAAVGSFRSCGVFDYVEDVVEPCTEDTANEVGEAVEEFHTQLVVVD